MKKVYTTLDLINNQYVGTVYDANTNNVLFKTEPQNSQINVTKEINNYITNTLNQKNNLNVKGSQQTIVNSVKYAASNTKSLPGQKRCCGR